VLQEARVFNEYPIVPKKCRLVLAKIVYLLYQGVALGEKEATDTFFSITKLFQNPDQSLRQMVYLVIKELSNSSKDVIMVTSSITKDMAARGELIYKPNAIRALVKITHPSMVQGIERFVKQAIVDKNGAVASAAIVSAIHLWQVNKDVVKRWTNEVQEATSTRGLATQYHAIGLLYQIRQHDRMAVVKLIQTFSRTLRSPYAHCLLIRYTAKCIYEEGSWTQLANQLWTVLTECMTNQRSEMVVFEAARCICSLPNLTMAQIKPAVQVLQLYMCNHKSVVKFAAIRALNDLAMTHPELVATCNVDMEGLISDPNRSVAIFAITALLKVYDKF
jgi:coatomer protein complex subunit gamma